MSAGVAVTFRNHFGRPEEVHRVETNLAQQKVNDGAMVFSLTNKDHYYDKPTASHYDKAFQEITNHGTGEQTLLDTLPHDTRTDTRQI